MAEGVAHSKERDSSWALVAGWRRLAVVLCDDMVVSCTRSARLRLTRSSKINRTDGLKIDSVRIHAEEYWT